MLPWALKYIKLGLSVIPLRPKGKEPLIPWTEYQKRRASENEVRTWWTKWPDANIGIITGAISGVVVVDLDGKEGLQQGQRLNLQSNCQSITGNGKHLWYQYPKDSDVQNAVKLYPGLDIRAEGGYVVAPPSIHLSGIRYRFQMGHDLCKYTQLTALPAIFFSSQKTVSTVLKQESWIAKALEGMKIGNIDDTLTSVAGRLRHDGYTATDALVLLLPHAERAGADPGHLEAKIENIWNRYEPKKEWTSGIQQRPTNSVSAMVIHSPTNPDSIIQFAQLRLESTRTNSSTGLATGYPKLDQMLFGGLKSSRLFTVAARTGTGKTNWLIGAARTLCESGKRVLLFSTETPYGEIWQRYIATLGNPKTFEQHQFYICDSFAPNLEKVEEVINDIKPDVFMFDHINHVSEEQRELGAFMQGLNYLRRKYECAGIVTAQLNRSADWIDLKTGEKVTPRMSMVKGSGTIEQASSRVLLLSETRITPEGTEIVGNLDKNDNGPRGMCHFMLYNNPYRMEQV